MPHETQILSHLIDEPRHYNLHSSLLHEGLFTKPFHRKVYAAYVALVKADKTPDLVNISEQTGNFDSVNKIINAINYNSTFEQWLHLATNAYREKILDRSLQKLPTIKSIDDKVEELRNIAASLGETRVEEPTPISTHIADVFKKIDENRKKKGFTGIATGLIDLDGFTNGLQPSDLVVLAADTSQGKTAMALGIARAAAHEQTPVALYSYEMNTTQLTTRIMAQETHTSAKQILLGHLNDEEIQHLHSQMGPLSDCPIYIEECQNNSLSHLINSMHGMVLRKGIWLFVIDYLQLIHNSGNKYKTKEQEIGEIARDLKNFAKATNTCVLLLSQLNRNQNKRNNGEPKLSDLRDSGQIEEAADIVLLIYRPEEYGIETYPDHHPTQGTAEIIIAKGRNIGLGTMRVSFSKENTLFTDLDQPPIHSPKKPQVVC